MESPSKYATVGCAKHRGISTYALPARGKVQPADKKRARYRAGHHLPKRLRNKPPPEEEEEMSDRKIPLTDEGIARLKARNLRDFPEHVVDGDPTKPAYTCEQCEHRYVCTESMDPYNTLGDCLASK